MGSAARGLTTRDWIFRGERNANLMARPEICFADAEEESRLHRGRGADIGPGNWSQHSDFQRRQYRVAAAAALQTAWTRYQPHANRPQNPGQRRFDVVYEVHANPGTK